MHKNDNVTVTYIHNLLDVFINNFWKCAQHFPISNKCVFCVEIELCSVDSVNR